MDAIKQAEIKNKIHVIVQNSFTLSLQQIIQ
jgi:hypothetical protein